MTVLLLDTHVLHWWSAETDRLSPAALTALENAREPAVADITWYELSWLAHHGRIVVDLPIGTWLNGLAESVRTMRNAYVFPFHQRKARSKSAEE